MNSLLASFLNDLSEYKIKQTLGVSEPYQRGILIRIFRHSTYQAPNEYKIIGRNKEVLGLVQEHRSSGPVPYCLRNAYVGKHRPMTFLITNKDNEPILYVKRSFHILNSKTTVLDIDYKVLGYIKRTFHPFIRKYKLQTKEKKLIAFIHSPIINFWTFPIFNLRRRKIGMIQKQWFSLGEYLTFRETLKVKCAPMSLEEKTMTLATGITISIDLFGPL